MEKSKKNKLPCPTCKGNGYVRVPYELAKEEVGNMVQQVVSAEEAQSKLKSFLTS